MNGGYDDGYSQCDCFWGIEPGSFVKLMSAHLHAPQDLKVLDAGCGEGKNAAFMAGLGASVDAIDVSELALRNGRRQWNSASRINWRCADLRNMALPGDYYDVVIAYGLLHCLRDREDVFNLLTRLQDATAPSGVNIICAFNSRFQELDAHPGFQPCLLDHGEYLSVYSSWEVLASSDQDLTERHPHNELEHTHSLTRIFARKAPR
jgi:SAM-dependent methyltransferase